MTFFIYSRKSVYSGKGESIENQIEMCRQYIASRFPAETEKQILIYEDEGFSAKNTERPRFQKMLRDIRRIRPEYLVCYRLDRISRSVSDFSALIEDLNKNGISFICIREEFDTSRPMGKAMMYIASVFAQLERETIAERVRDNMLMLARSGRWLGGTPPTGYCSDKTHEILLDGKIKNYCMLQENHAESAAVRRIFAEYRKIRSLSGVCGVLSGYGITSRSGKPYTPAVVRQILKNPVYCTADEAAYIYFTQKGAEVCFDESAFQDKRGLIAYNKRDYKKNGVSRRPAAEWIVAPGRHPGLIPGAQWVAVQELLGEKQTKPHNSYSLLSGMLFCGTCGSAMYAKPRSGNPGSPASFDYICRTKLNCGIAGCPCKNLNGPAADRSVLSYLIRHAPAVTDMRESLEKLLRKFDSDGNSVVYAQKEIEKREREIEALLASLPGRSQKSAFVSRVEQRINALEQEILTWEKMRIEPPPGALPESYREIARGEASKLLDPAQYIPLLSVKEQRALLRLFFRKAVWTANTLQLF